MSFEGPKGTYTFRREDHQALQPMYIVEMVPDPQHPWAIPRLIHETAPEETAPPVKEAVTVTKDYIIETDRLRREFGALVAVANVSIQVRPNTIHSIIGPNGAGKTTFFNLLSGTLEPTSGRVHYKGRDITNLPLHRTAHLGIGRSFQITNIFPNLTVLENIRLACQALGKGNFQIPALPPLVPRVRGAGPGPSFGRWVWSRRRCNWRERCPTAASASWNWASSWPPTRSCCCWTSQPPAWRPNRSRS